MNNILIIGRPNVGKSTLFNAICGKKLAITGAQSGVTRDVKTKEININYKSVRLMDSGGLELQTKSNIALKINDSVNKYIDRADILLFLIDGSVGVTHYDKEIANIARASGKPVVLVINKTDKKSARHSYYEAQSLGFEDMLELSAEHKDGVDMLKYHLSTMIDEDEKDKEERLKIAIVGRPNVGKSTLINTIIKEDLQITESTMHTTRDTVSFSIVHKNNPIEIIDTAGISKNAQDNEEFMKESFRAIDFSHVVILLTDIENPINTQDMKILQYAILEGRSVIIAVNKLDLVNQNKMKDITKSVFDYTYNRLSEIRELVTIPISSRKNINISKLLNESIRLHKLWNTKVPTSRLNNILTKCLNNHNSPFVGNKKTKVKYIYQIGTRPPTFAMWVNTLDVPNNYVKYIRNTLQNDLNLNNISIRLLMKKGKNPYFKSKATKTPKKSRRVQ